MPADTLIHYLEENDVDYEILRHDRAYTAQEAAAAAHISGDAFAKAVMLIVDGEMGMAVLPASFRVTTGEDGNGKGVQGSFPGL
jgi:Ala-tRNA(Pro) deacylase